MTKGGKREGSGIGKPKEKWSGAITYIGMNHIYLVIDRRNMNTLEDFVDEMTRPKSSYLLRMFR